MKQTRTSKNRNPEKTTVKFDLLPYLCRIGADVDVIESKAVFSVKAGRYLKGSAPVGMSDLVGNLQDGTAIFIEAKAPGFRKNVSVEQRKFLIRKIVTGCFAVVADSSEYIHQTLNVWLGLRHTNPDAAREYLISDLSN